MSGPGLTRRQLVLVQRQIDDDTMAAALAYAEGWCIVAAGLGVGLDPFTLVRSLTFDTLRGVRLWEDDRRTFVAHLHAAVEAEVRLSIRAAVDNQRRRDEPAAAVRLTMAQLGELEGLLQAARHLALMLIGGRQRDRVVAGAGRVLAAEVRSHLAAPEHPPSAPELPPAPRAMPRGAVVREVAGVTRVHVPGATAVVAGEIGGPIEVIEAADETPVLEAAARERSPEDEEATRAVRPRCKN